MSASPVQRIERVCIAFDAATRAQDALEAAASLASELDAELAGFFLEDVNLLRAAALSFTREMGLASGTSRPLELGETERALRAQAQSVQSSVAAAAEGLQLRWSFTTVRGASITPVLALADAVSLAVMAPRAGLSDARLSAPGRRGASALRAVAVLDDGSAEALKAVQFAALLARNRRGPLVVIASARRGRDDDASQKAIDALTVGGDRIAVRHVSLPAASAAQTAAAVREHAAGVLVVGAAAVATAQEAAALLARVECPVVVVAGGAL